MKKGKSSKKQKGKEEEEEESASAAVAAAAAAASAATAASAGPKPVDQSKVKELQQKCSWFHSRRQFAQCLACLKQLLELRPKNYSYLTNASAYAGELGRFDESLDLARKALEVARESGSPGMFAQSALNVVQGIARGGGVARQARAAAAAEWVWVGSRVGKR